MANNKKVLEMYEYYKTGLSLSEVGKIYSISRQSVYAAFKRRNFELRPKKFLPFIIVDGLKFTIRFDGYYYCTTNDNLSLHRLIWEKENGIVPKGYQLHHIDENKLNNDLSNLQLVTIAEHTKIHSERYKGAPNNKKVICKNNGKIYPSFADAERKNNLRKGSIGYSLRVGKSVSNLEFELC